MKHKFFILGLFVILVMTFFFMKKSNLPIEKYTTPEEEIARWRKAVKKDNPGTLFALGVALYYHKTSTKKEGLMHIREAADQGNADAKKWLDLYNGGQKE